MATVAANLLTYVLNLYPHAAIVNAIDNGGVLVCSTLLSFFLFKERMSWMQVVGTVLCVAAIAMLSL